MLSKLFFRNQFLPQNATWDLLKSEQRRIDRLRRFALALLIAGLILFVVGVALY